MTPLRWFLLVFAGLALLLAGRSALMTGVAPSAEAELDPVTRVVSDRDAATVPSANAPTRPPPAVLTGPLPQGDFLSIRAELEALALAGHGEAALKLGLAPAFCDWLASTGGDIDALGDRLVDDAAVLTGEMPMLGFSAHFEIIALAVIHNAEQQLEFCQGVGEEVVSEVHANRRERVPELLAWAERAAQAGEVDAMLGYASLALRDVEGPAEVVEMAETLLIRRERAAYWVREALAQGHAEALSAHAYAHWRGWPLERDPVKAYAYLLAYQASGDTSGEHPRVLAYLDERLGGRIDAEQRDQARRLAEELVRCCG